MLVLSRGIEILVFVRNAIRDKLQSRIYAQHISDIVIADYSDGKGDDVKKKPLFSYKLLNGKGDNGKPYQSVRPHSVALINYGIGAKRVDRGKHNDGQLVLYRGALVEIKAEGKTAKTCLDKNHRNERVKDHFLGEKKNDKGEGTCKIIKIYTEKFSAKRS